MKVSEPNPVALDALFEIVGYAQDRMVGELKKQFEEIVGPARAELAQLQAEREEANAIIQDIVREGSSTPKLYQKAREYLRKVGL